MNSQRPVRLAIDVGGTFTDIQVFDARDGSARAHKTPTTPHDPSEGLVAGVREAGARFGFGLDQVALVLHGTTIATNAVLERKLPPGALLTNAGFEDVLEIGRHLRRDLYALKPPPKHLLIPRHRRFGVAGRLAPDGRELAPLDLAAVPALAARLRTEGVAAVAIALLHAYAEPGHEQRLAEALRHAAPELTLSLSSAISPEMREFERTSTTVLNALLVPVVEAYIGRLQARLAEAGCTAPLHLVQSNGGVTPPARAATEPVRLLLSGPAGGAMAAARLAGELAGPDAAGADLANIDLVGIDMGGTSSDVTVVRGGRHTIVAEGEIDGHPVRVPMVEMRTIGAGGGSIAWIDTGGRLRVGPQSAGAVPGPVAYGRGGTAPTVTDANLALGLLDPDFFLGGALRLDRPAAERAIEDAVARPLGLGGAEAAAGIVAVANVAMAAAIRLSLFEKGADPRDFALLPFGGAAGLHAVAIAEELDMRRVVFPADSATLSARGILFADMAHDLARSRLLPADDGAANAIQDILRTLREEGDAMLARDGIAPADRAFEIAADMRYRGQAFELMTPWDGGSLADLREGFHALHEARFAHADRAAPTEIVTLRLTALGRLPKPQVKPETAAGGDARKGMRRVFLGGAWRDVPVLDRTRLSAAVEGPCIVEEEYTTLLVPAGWVLSRRPSGDLVADRAEGVPA